MSIRVMSDVFDSGAYEGAALLVLLVCADHANDAGGDVFPSNATIAFKARLDVRSVQRIRRRLEADGVLVPEANEAGGRGRTRRYRIDLARLKAVGRRDRAARGELPGGPAADGKRATESHPLRPAKRATESHPLGSGKGDSDNGKGDSGCPKGRLRSHPNRHEPSKNRPGSLSLGLGLPDPRRRIDFSDPANRRAFARQRVLERLLASGMSLEEAWKLLGAAEDPAADGHAEAVALMLRWCAKLELSWAPPTRRASNKG